MRKLFKKLAQNCRGGVDPIVTIIFAAIVILAIVAISPTIQELFSDMADKFSVWLNAKLDALFH